MKTESQIKTELTRIKERYLNELDPTRKVVYSAWIACLCFCLDEEIPVEWMKEN